MRDLTEKELEKWPHWATHYRVDESRILFESKDKWMEVGTKFPFISRGPFKQNSKLTKCREKPVLEDKKPFDITQHEWSDSIADIEAESGDTLVLKFHGSWISIDKDDAIAIAKHFNLTAEDLERG